MWKNAAAPRLVFIALACALTACESDAADTEAGGAVSAGTLRLPESIASVPVPDSELARAAADLALSTSPPFLGNHIMRPYAFGALLLEAQGREFDPELGFAAVMLHDLGLVEQYISADRRFELDSADAAATFLTDHGRSPEEVELVWEAIALHLTGEIANRMAPEIALVSLGAAADAAGVGLEVIDPAEVDAILSAYPRLGFKEEAMRGIVDQCERKPFAYALHPWAEVGRRYIPDFAAPTVEDLIRGAPFAD